MTGGAGGVSLRAAGEQHTDIGQQSCRPIEPDKVDLISGDDQRGYILLGQIRDNTYHYSVTLIGFQVYKSLNKRIENYQV